MQLEVGTILEGKVTGITKFGAFVDIGDGKTGMVHISEVAPTYVTEIRDHVSENQTVKVKVLSIGEDGKISLSIKRAMENAQKNNGSKNSGGRGNFNRNEKGNRGPARPANIEWNTQKDSGSSFEDMLSKFKQTSDDKQSDLKRGNKDVRRPRRNYADNH